MVVAGPYVRVRNPLLAGIVLALAGTALALASWGLAAGVLCVWAAAHVWVVRIEEPRLAERFGAAYTAYRDHVPRWLPRCGRPAAGDGE
jgi:protein-S-isoprenylcysteine O-methyltransferase Ste14